MSSFSDLDLIEPLQRALAAQRYHHPTPIQALAIPPLLEGRDVLGCAQTGTGKTAAFCLPVLQHLSASRRAGKRRIRALVLTPTRELAAQIRDSLSAYGKYLDQRHTVIYGGVSERPQIQALRGGIDVLVATPGRLLDLHGRGFVDLSSVDFFVLDEADRMLDMGFIHDVRKVIAQLPAERQNLLFSATMPPSIVKLASSFLREPVTVEATPPATTVELIDQQVMFVDRSDKCRLLADLLEQHGIRRTIVFTRTKHGANRLVKQLDRAKIRAAAIHGNKSQGARTRALEAFRRGTLPVLIATDIASRGIDVDDISHVFNYDLPNIPESYVHRIGRTARAGKGGTAISFCDQTERSFLWAIEKLIGLELTVVSDHPYHLAEAAKRPRPAQAADRPSRSSRRRPASSGRRNSPGRGHGARTAKADRSSGDGARPTAPRRRGNASGDPAPQPKGPRRRRRSRDKTSRGNQ